MLGPRHPGRALFHGFEVGRNASRRAELSVTPSAFRQFQTACEPTPNQYISAPAHSARIARARSALPHNPDPPCCPRTWTQGHGIRPSWTPVTTPSVYRARWNNELDLGSIKSALQMRDLRCKTPELVRKEVWAHILAYNLIRIVMAQAAAEYEVVPRSTASRVPCRP